MLQTHHHHPIPKKPKITGLNDYRPVALMSVVMKSFEKLVLAHLKGITGPSLDPLPFAYRANRSVDDAVNMGLHYVLQHLLDRPAAYVRIRFVDFSSAFNTIIPNLLLPKLTQLSVPTSICQWINSFLTDRQQLVRLGIIHIQHIINCLVQLSYQIWPQKTTEGSPDSWANHWYNPPQYPGTVLIQNDQMGCQNNSGPLTSSTLPLWTDTIWSTLQKSEYQNDQTPEQFLPSSNPSHEHLKIIMVHTIFIHLFI